MNQPQLGSYEHIALSAIRPSTTNPRKNFDPAALEELAVSIREMGVTEPILVRPLGDDEWLEAHGTGEVYEIVTGERRYKASRLAGNRTIPARVRDLTDEEAMDLQLVENLQRADLHPIEEAEGYRALMAGGTSSIDDVARKAGKTQAYVAQRLKLLGLELPVKTLFHAGHINLGHALILARLTPPDQDRAVRQMAGLNQLPKSADTAAEVGKRIADHEKHQAGHRLIRDTESELRQWVSSHVLLSLEKVTWNLSDALLVPEAGACTTCPKRTGTNAALFADITAKEDVCLDPACYETKRKASERVVIQAAAESGKPLLKLSAKSGHKPLGDWKPEKTVLRYGQWVTAKHKSCSSATKGILVDAPGSYGDLSRYKQGDQVTACADQKCHIHKHTVDKPGGANGNHPSNHNDRELKEKAYIAAESSIRLAVIDAIKAKAEPGIYEVRSAVFDHLREYAYICREMEWPFKEDKAPWQANQNAANVVEKEIERADLSVLGHLVLLDALARKLEPASWMYADRKGDRKLLWQIAEHYEVDADAIAAEIEAEAKAGAAETKPAKAAPKKPAKKTAAKKPKLSAAGRQRIADAMKKRWNQRVAARPSTETDGKSKAAGARAGVA